MPKDYEPGAAYQPLPIAGMLPRAFICSICQARVQETIYGSGFQNCGSLKATTEKWFCASCMSKVLAFVEALKRGDR